MTTTVTLNNKQSNDELCNLIKENKPFLISRLSDNATKLSIFYDIYKKIHPQFKQFAKTHDGIYSNNDIQLELYTKFYLKALQNSTKIACFPKLCIETQNYVIKKYKMNDNDVLHNKILEPFYLLDENKNAETWSHLVKDKTILIISPFVKSFEKQVNSGFTFYGKNDNRKIWHENQKFIFYKAYNTLYNNHPHKSWFETFMTMANDIKKLNFDIALLSCGGYGLPLCNFIYEKMNKSSIYMGGSLQLLFGVYGKRWLNHNIIGKLIKNGTWIRPSQEEQPENFKKIEGGCYW